MLVDFVESLLSGRDLKMGEPELPEEGDVLESIQRIRRFERTWRIEVPGAPPELDADAVRWSIISVYLAASLIVHRDTDLEVMTELLGSEPPDRALPATHYSVDLVMRFLPDLVRLGKSASRDDPLNEYLETWGRDWPLSSVGIKNLGSVDAMPLRTSPSLMRLYIDRIFAASDIERLNDAAVRHLATTVLGDYPQLNSEIARAIKSYAASPETELYKNDEPERQ